MDGHNQVNILAHSQGWTAPTGNSKIGQVYKIDEPSNKLNICKSKEWMDPHINENISNISHITKYS